VLNLGEHYIKPNFGPNPNEYFRQLIEKEKQRVENIVSDHTRLELIGWRLA
jgi:hypothetical protein